MYSNHIVYYLFKKVCFVNKYVPSLKDHFKVAEWELVNSGMDSDWWRDTEFLCPATLRAVCNLSTMVTIE